MAKNRSNDGDADTTEYIVGDPDQSAKVSVFLDILSNVALVLGNNALENKGMGRIVTLLSYATQLVRDVTQGIAGLQEVDKQVQSFVDGGRTPSDEEWAAWDERLAGVDNRFAAMRAQLK